MPRMNYCPVVGGACNKPESDVTVQADTFFLAEPFTPEEEKIRRECAVKSALRECFKGQFSETILKVADKEPKDPAIFCDICRMIQSSAYGIVDLSGLNPNALLELGMMFSSGKPVFVLVKKSEQENLKEKLPSDILWKRVVPYGEFIDIVEELSTQIKNRPKVELEPSLGEKAKEVFAKLDPAFAQTIDAKLQEFKREQNEALGRMENLLKEAKLGEAISQKTAPEVSPSVEKQIEELRKKAVSLEELVGVREDYEIAFLKGNWLVHKKKYQEALELFDRALALKPNLANAWGNKGYALSELRKYEEAIACYDKAIEIKPDYEIAWNNKGVAFGNLGKYEEAIACHDKAIEIKPSYEYAWSNKGVAFAHFGRWEDAKRCYEEALKIKPDDVSVLENLSEAFLALGDASSGLDMAEKAFSLSEDIEDKIISWFLRISAYFFKGETEKAKKEKEGLTNYLRGLEKGAKVTTWDFSTLVPTIEKKLDGENKQELLSLISLLKGETEGTSKTN